MAAEWIDSIPVYPNSRPATEADLQELVGRGDISPEEAEAYTKGEGTRFSSAKEVKRIVEAWNN